MCGLVDIAAAVLLIGFGALCLTVAGIMVGMAIDGLRRGRRDV